jgi:transcriptional regulator with XRE-family HTH domain
MTLLQLRRVFQRHYGESARLARQLGLSRGTVSKWFRGHVSSRRIETAVRERASELCQRERRVRGRSGSRLAT